MEKKKNVPTQRLSKNGILGMLTFMTAFPPLSTDLYLPALPNMVSDLNTTDTLVNLTLAAFFIVFAVSLLFWGPLSEKYGRRPTLLVGLGIYIASSIGCACAPTIDILITMRIFQGFGGGASVAIGTAITKDLYDGREREKVMALVMSLFTIAPIVGPIAGGILLKFFSWQVSFLTLAMLGTTAFILSLFFTETLPKISRYNGSLAHAYGRLIFVMRNRGFRLLIIPFTLIQAVLFAFIGAASYIYVRQFHLSEQAFSLFFSFNAVATVLGPLLYVWLSKRISWQSIVTANYILMLFGALLLATIGNSSPWLFAVAAAPGSLAVTTLRVPSTNLMLEQMQTDTGSLSALINFFTLALGTVGMMGISYFPGRQIPALAIITLVIGAGCGLAWFYARSQPDVILMPDQVSSSHSRE